MSTHRCSYPQNVNRQKTRRHFPPIERRIEPVCNFPTVVRALQTYAVYRNYMKDKDMVNPKRNRSEGWSHAKNSGHANETAIEYSLKEEPLNQLGYRLGKKGMSGEAKVGGKGEKSVPCILGGKTKSKTDLKIIWNDGSISNISIKKSLGGQAFLIGTERFIDGFERHFTTIPKGVKKALRLYIGGPEVKPVLKEIPATGTDLREYELRKGRMVWDTLRTYDCGLAAELLSWSRLNVGSITRFCFSRGLARDESDWASHIWYKNLIGENNTDELFNIDDLVATAGMAIDRVAPGPKNGGSTILFPFGFLQWHQKKMQFHHGFESISECLILGTKPKSK
ncbi:MAG: hypothetical protein HXX12_13675 [Geothrix sp.]|uniref:hypothetical protein n=1 Tax=Geothrix sp. TaxID=1962974 RepID=UPI001831E17B|nr:hypothetical protein [Geothrix sp.]NWJ42007.1 hypothetical protein [Geothrix sp.]WIL22448.1 MAG: hypothetical protein QOZ81_002565 [Geothrix sp.]